MKILSGEMILRYKCDNIGENEEIKDEFADYPDGLQLVV